jgi:formate dehydrogenase major subunit
MQVTRRQFLKGSGAVVAGGVTLATLGIDVKPAKAYAMDMTRANKVKSAKQTTSICCYCSVGCGVICYTDSDGKIIHVEGDPDHPINEGTLCPKGANLYQTSAANEYRLTKVQYRAPYSDKWEEKDWDWALTQMAKKIKAIRDSDFVTTNSKGNTVNRLETIAFGGSSNVDNEECYMMTSFARGLGLVYLDHQARV